MAETRMTKWYEDPVYHMMCERAEEIQATYNVKQGDLVLRVCEYPEYEVGLVSWNRDRGIETLRWKVLDREDGITLDSPNSYYQKLIWLPRQDELQLLSGLGWYLFDKTCITWATTNLSYQSESKEIVGLRVVYKEKYNKVWNGKEWVSTDVNKESP